VRVDFDPGYVAPRHTHFGEEIIYVLEGTLVYEVEGRPPTTVQSRRRSHRPRRARSTR